MKPSTEAGHHQGAVIAVMAFLTAVVPLAQSDLTLRSQDVLDVTVIGQADLSTKYDVDTDGTVTFPLIGRVQVAGLAVEQLAAELERRLAEFFRDPQVRLQVERPRRVFIFGGVGAPGMYQLTDRMTLIEILARAGYTGTSEVIIVRSSGAQAPALPAGSGDAEVIRVNMRELERDLESGELSRNVVLADGDTIFVPRFDPNRVYVSGQVRNPGAYSVPEGTTVLQALALAGGATEDASLGRLRIYRLVGGEQKTIRVDLEDVVNPGDTIVVPKTFF